MARIPVTLALGGGGARGAAHLGVIEALEQSGYEIKRIVGVSIGSVLGSMYALHADIDRVKSTVLEYLTSDKFQQTQRVLFGARKSNGDQAGGMFGWYDKIKSYMRGNRVFHRVATHPSMLPGVMLQDIYGNLVPDGNIEDTAIPLSIVALDLRTGDRVVLESGPLRIAAQASSAIPGIFPPVPHQGMQLCDIGTCNSLPAGVARNYQPRFVIGVDVSSPLTPIDGCESALDVLIRVNELGEAMCRQHARSLADLVIQPDVGSVKWYDFSQTDRLIEAGFTAGLAAMRRARLAA